MKCLYWVERKEGAFFQEQMVDRDHPETALYSADVARKSDPLLIVFLNSFQEADFDLRGIPEVFSRMLFHFQKNRSVQAAWRKGGLNHTFVEKWLASDDWKTGLAGEEPIYLFFYQGILEMLLEPVNDCAKSIMTADWRRPRIFGLGENPYLRYLRHHITEYGMLWFFLNHHADDKVDGSIGLLPEGKVRFFCRSYLHRPLDVQKKETRNDRGEDISDFRGFCRKVDEAYQQETETSGYCPADSLLDTLCLSALHFAIYGVPVRRCSLCRRFYIPVKNQTADMNFCHRMIRPDRKQSCSAYHSHNQKISFSNGQETPEERFDKGVRSVRSALSQSKVNDLPNGPGWISFLKDALTVVNRVAKKDAGTLPECQALREEIKDLHRLLKQQGSCPELTLPAFHTRKDDLKVVSERLREAKKRMG